MDDPARSESKLATRIRERRLHHARRGYPYRVGFAGAGFAVLGAGAVLLVLPGPGLLVIALGLGMLALEFRWAERLLLRVAELGARPVRLVRKRRP